MKSIQTLCLNKFGWNPIQTELNLIYIWINPCKNGKLHYYFGPQCSPQPQWLTGSKPSLNDPNHGLWPAHAVVCAPSARPTRGHRAMRVQRMRHDTALTDVPVAYRWWGVELHLLQLTGYKPLHQDLGEAGQRGVSPVRRSGWRWPTSSKVEPRVRSVKNLPHWPLSCTRPPQTLDRASSAARAQEQELTGIERRSAAGGGVEAKILARWLCKLGQKECMSEGSKSSNGMKE
jgi:hypothetical protein